MLSFGSLWLATATLFWHMQVARAMVDGVCSEAFIPKAADGASGLLIGSCLTPCSPRPFPLLVDMLMAPMYVLLHRWLKGQIESKTLAIFHRQSRARQANLLLPALAVILAVCCSWAIIRLAL